MIYIKRNILGVYREYPEPFDPELNGGVIGTTFEDFLQYKWVPLSDELVLFHKLHPEASVKEVFDMQIYEKPIEYVRYLKIQEIIQYDNSEEVNSFSINGVDMWLTVLERQLLATLINAFEAVGRETMTRWFNGTEFTFTINQWKQMLTLLEIYAGDALNATEAHKAAINNFSTIEEINSYDITAGYPQKLVF